jgi:hypothetical protein
MAKTTGDSLKIEVWGSDRVAQGASALVAPSQSTIEKGFVDGIANANDFTWVPNILGAKINHCLQNGVATWNNTTAYVAGNMVTHSNKAWQCLVGNTNSTPADGNANWDKMLSVGTPPSLNSVLPSQTGNANKVLTTNGTNASWGNVPFATVNFDGTTAANLTGTFTRALAIVTANVTAHGHLVGHRIYFVGAGVTSGWYTVATVADANTFTFDSGVSGAIGSTACTLQRRSIRSSINVQSVAYASTGNFAINFINFSLNANYNVIGTATDAPTVIIAHWSTTPSTGQIVPTTGYFHIYSDNPNVGAKNVNYNHIAVFP